MTNRQFNFSVCVGVALAAVGTIILGQAAVGLSLIALGAAIAALAVFTRVAANRAKPARAAASPDAGRKAVPGYQARALAE